MNDPFTHPETLLRETGWLQSLVRQLVADEDQTQEVVQETLLVAVRTNPPPNRGLRPWLAQVARNLVRRSWRMDHTRRHREELVARQEEQPATLLLVEQIEAQQSVVQAVLRLREPYRTVVLQHYFRHLSATDIAHRTSTSVNTVYTRLRRAHEQLRQQLNRVHGDRRSWLVALQPLAASPTVMESGAGAIGGAIAKGATIMGSKATLAAVAVVAVAASAVTWSGLSDGGPVADPASGPSRPQRDRANPIATVTEPDLEVERLSDESPAADKEIEPTPEVAIPTLPQRGRYVDLDQLKKELTPEKVGILTTLDESPEVQEAVLGLVREDFDPDSYLAYVEAIFAESWEVPGLGELTQKDERVTVSSHRAYGNSIGQACSLSTSVSVHEDGSEHVTLMLFTPGHWLDISGQPRLQMFGSRRPDRSLNFQFKVNPQAWRRRYNPSTGESRDNPNYDDIQRRKKAGMFGRAFFLQVDESETRTGFGDYSDMMTGPADSKAGIRLRRLLDEMLREAGLTDEEQGDSQ